MICHDEGDRLIIYASAAGRPNNPAWYYNVVANPEVTVEYGTDHFTAQAMVVSGAERDRLWAEQVARMPTFAAYEENTDRIIPVVALERIP